MSPMTDDDGGSGDDDLAAEVDAFHAALAEDGLDGRGVEVEPQIEALVASGIPDAVFWALVAAGPTGFVAEFAKLQAQNTDSALRRLLGRIGKRRRVIVSEPEQSGERVVQVVITPELPEEAYKQLEARRPPAPSGRLVWDPETLMWRDSMER